MLERPDGSRIIAWSISLLSGTKRGERIGAINCFLDISERRAGRGGRRNIAADFRRRWLASHEQQPWVN